MARGLRARATVAAALAVAGAAAVLPAPAAAGFRAQLERRGLVELTNVEVELRYATKDNFTEAVLPGYCGPHAFLRRRAARALARAQAALAPDGLALRVYDAYRPARASRAMVRWARRTGHERLLHGLIAPRSNHNRGAAVDLTLVRAATGRPLDMGTPYDSFSSRAATRAVGGKPLRNRLRLKRALEREGFRNYRREWWHFDFPRELGAPRIDVALGC